MLVSHYEMEVEEAEKKVPRAEPDLDQRAQQVQ